MKKLKRFIVVLVILIAAFAVYVEIANRKTKNMTYKQKVLKAIYPVFMWFNKLAGTHSKHLANKEAVPPVSFYSLKAKMNNGDTLDFTSLKGKKVMIVNTASDCGYTSQYNDLEQLHEQFKDKLVVLGFPANDFKKQEKGTDEEIAQFCKVNFGVTFPLMQKSVVIKSAEQNPVYRWLTDTAENGWNKKAPSWNFSKYLVDENGKLIHYFDPSVSPVSSDVINAIQ
jgi:glutathione peroxidase